MNKPSIPKGTRDFSPEEMARRNYIFNTIKDVFSLYGFQQIETPAMETLHTLMGKYGEEGDKLLFKVLNSGDYMSKVSDEELAGRNSLKLASKLCEKGLRYDLTVPFARYVVMHRDELQLPFRRYQIQPVWRADRPQKGRYREFYQCDADVVGSDSLLNEVEQKLQPIISMSGTNESKLDVISHVLSKSEIGLKGVDEVRYILDKLKLCNLKNEIQLDLTLARGLNYYTGAIFEVKALDYPIGSISGGGRYDNLTGIFGMPGLSGVGISFGADRIYDVLNGLNLYPADALNSTRLLFINFGETETAYCMPYVQKCRQSGIATEIYPDSCKMKKQMNYANAKGIAYVALAGESEMADGVITVKDMKTGEQRKVSPEELLSVVSC